ncbi:MAG: hypothetical protein V4812_06710 [Pseudomonadota bacterium]
MRRLVLLASALVFSAPLWAMHCPADMAKIDQRLDSNPPKDAAVLSQVKTLRAQGEELHKAGEHSQSVEALGQALKLLDASE